MKKKKRNKNRKKLIFVVLAEVIFIVGIAGYIFLGNERLSVLFFNKDHLYANALETYMDSVRERDYERMYEQISEESKQAITKEDFVKRNKNIYEGIEAGNLQISDIEVFDNTISGNGKIVSYKSALDTIAGSVEFTNDVVVKRHKKEYQIAWDSKVIFPELTDTDKVQVSTAKGKRGTIYDRNGSILAGNGTVASVGLVPGKMAEDNQKDIKKIASILNVDEESIQKKLSADWVKEDSFVPLKSISQDENGIKDQLLGISGILISDKAARVYPYGEAAAHLTGYVQAVSEEDLKEREGQGYNSSSEIGKIGMESLLEERIRGIDGCEVKIVDEEGNKKQTLAKQKAVNGEDVTLTIDMDVQVNLYEKLKKDKSSNVVMNPLTGEVIALVSTPSYDPNEFILGLSGERWAELNEDEGKPMYNRFKAVLCPGSSFKPVTAAAGLTANKITASENFGHSGLRWRKDDSWGSYYITTLKDYGNQAVLRNAMIYSDNIYFAKAALKIGKDTLAKELLNMGFYESMPFEFGLSTSTFGSEQQFGSEVELADSGYGQGKVLVNPVHMASIYSAFMNDGNMIQPYLEKKDNKTPEFWKKQVFSKEAVNEVKDSLIQVVENPGGTGRDGKVSGLTIAGKTGTAEIKASKDDNAGTELGWFNAFLVDQNPQKQYLVISMVEDVKGRGGSHYVIPIVRSVFTQ